MAKIRSERDGSGNGRVYNVNFEANDDRGGTCNGTIVIAVPHSQNGTQAVDDGQSYNSTGL